MARPSLSVAMCTYNGEAYLPAQLASFVAQERLPDELIVCDDASTDGTVELVRRFAGSAPFAVRIHENARNLRSTKNFEKAIALCSGDLIALSDQDDVWDPRKLAVLAERLAANPGAQAAFSDAEMVDPELRPLGRRLWRTVRFPRRAQGLMRAGRALEVLLNHNVVTGATMMFRAAVRSAVIPFPPEWVHDGWIAAVIAATARLEPVPEPLILYRQHPRQQLGAPERTFLADSMRVARERVTASDAARRAYARDDVLYSALLERLDALRCPPEALARVRGKIEHLRVRASIPESGFARARLVLGELVRGRYFKYSRAWRSALKDLVA